MDNRRYSRQLAPSDPKSLTDFLNREFQKIQTVLDEIRAELADHEARITALEP